jgi:acyl carrier protein
LPEYMVPSTIVRLERLPLTANGKLDRRALPEAETAGIESGGYEAPRDEAEEILSGIWAQVLKLERVGIRDNFFDLGGHSLLATQVISRVRQALEIELPLRTLFESPTVEAMSEQLRAVGEKTTRPPLMRRERSAGMPLSYAQQRLWFLDQLEPDSAVYHVPAAVRLSGKLRMEPLVWSLRRIVERHEVLRTRFVSRDGEPEQDIIGEVELGVPLVDLSGLEAEERESVARHLAAEQGITL